MARRSSEPVRRPTVSVQLGAVDASGRVQARPDRLVTEEPMEIRVHGPGEAPMAVAVTMRTPGHDFDLAIGFLHSEGIVAGPDDIAQAAYCMGPDGEQEYNVVTVRTRRPVVDRVRPRPFTANSSCGVCGKATLDDLATHCPTLHGVGPMLDVAVVHELPARLAARQVHFDATGGVHGVALVDSEGVPFIVREDVGRHNALDKCIGAALVAGRLPLHDSAAVVSGRLGFELVQKAAVAGIPVIVAVGAPTSLAVETARRLGQTVVAFARDGRCNVYTVPERIVLGD